MARSFLAAAGRGLSLTRLAWSAARLRRASTDAARDAARRQIALRMAESRGLAMKVGQLLAGAPGGEPFEQLVTGVAPLPLDALLPGLERGLGRPAAELFSEIDPIGQSASLGQVHRARLRSGGEEVAIKLRLPGVAGAVQAELKLAALVPFAGPVRRFGFDRAGYLAALGEDLARELDYRSEAGRQELLHRSLQLDGLVVPRVFPELCSEAVLTQGWEPGEPFATAAALPLRARLQLGSTLVLSFLRMLFGIGELHADPHDGNVRVRLRDGAPELVLLDYGCTVSISGPRRLALLRLVLELRSGHAADAAGWLGAAGFDPRKLRHLEGSLPELCRILLEPLLVDRPFRVADWRAGERTGELLGELRWWFRSAGPPDLLLLIRAAAGLARQLRLLDVALPWAALLPRAVGPAVTAAALSLPAPERAGSTVAAGARLLRVRVTGDGNEPIELALPAAAALELEEVVPAAVVASLRRDGLDLGRLSAELRREGLAPRLLLERDDGGRSIRAWLE